MLSSVGLEHLAHNQTVLGSSPRASIRRVFHGNTAEMQWAGFASLNKPGNRDKVTYQDTGAWRLIFSLTENQYGSTIPTAQERLRRAMVMVGILR